MRWRHRTPTKQPWIASSFTQLNRLTSAGKKTTFPQLRKKMLENRCFFILISGARDLAAI
jgi:hypothetical protein